MMKSVSVTSIKGNKTESPKTPGGISKSLLTPCRRVGLSRNWKKNGPSPFISPLSGAEVKSPVVEVKREKRKRKDRGDGVENEDRRADTHKEKQNNSGVIESLNKEIHNTPSRSISIPKKKKSKIITPIVDDGDLTKTAISLDTTDIGNDKKDDFKQTSNIVATPSRTKSKSKTKLSTSIVASISKDNDQTNLINCNSNEVSDNLSSKQRSPENLTKECMVVIQKKLFKKADQKLKPIDLASNKVNLKSQVLFDSDSDDLPLSAVAKKVDKQTEVHTEIIDLDEDNDFEENPKINVKKLQDKTTSTGGLKTKTCNKIKVKQINETLIKSKVGCKVQTDPITSSQSSFDDDDFVTDKKRTILIRKTYDKVITPFKAKSTGSITQKDIDDLKARIEFKKKMLLAKAVSEDTEELRELIKKWQRGCQDALMELMELMKSKCPDKQNMDYSEILQNLKIPPQLVGYDEENDCFGTPTDENIILSKFNNF